MHSLQRFLVDYDMSMLRALAQNRGVELTTNRQTEAADFLAAALLEPLSVRVALAQLSSQGREALDAILARGGRMRAPHFARRFGQVRPIGPGRLEREAPWQEPCSPAEELLYLALVFRAFHEEEGGPGEFVFIPDDLVPLLPEPPQRPLTFSVDSVPAPPQASLDDSSGEALVLDLFAYLVYLQNNDVRPYGDGRLARRDLSALREKMVDPDAGRLAFLRHLAAGLGFVILRERILRLEGALVRDWLSLPFSGQLTSLQEVWRDDRAWTDLCRVPSLECDPKMDWHLRHNPVAPRHALLALLARCPLDAWWPVGSFVAAVKEIHPDFLRPDGDYASWYIRDVATGAYLSGFESWDHVEGAYVADLVTRLLNWLGVVASAAGEGGTLCRLTATGARFLGRLPAEPESLRLQRIVVAPDFGITVPGPVNLYHRFQLERFASLESSAPCRYRLTAGSIWHALNLGIQIEQIVAYLQQSSEGPVPPNVVGQLRLWAGRYGQVELEDAVVLRVKDERALRELSVLPETRRLLDTVLTPTLALVRKRDMARLRRVLGELGYLPPGSDEPGGDQAKRG